MRESASHIKYEHMVTTVHHRCGMHSMWELYGGSESSKKYTETENKNILLACHTTTGIVFQGQWKVHAHGRDEIVVTMNLGFSSYWSLLSVSGAGKLS